MIVALVSTPAGCLQTLQKATQRPWHAKYDWNAGDFFDDPQVIALCHAIEANDLDEIDRLIAEGADVNAQGKGNMTPLLWAYPDNKLDRFKRLLEHGADPNVVFESDFNVQGYQFKGNSITHMACATHFPGYFEAVFENGGDPNLVKNGIVSKRTCLFTLISGAEPDKAAKTATLVELGADLDHVDGTGLTPVKMAVGWGGQFTIGLMLLESGADYKHRRPDSLMRLIHVIVKVEPNLEYCTPQQKADYHQLVQWLEDHGESINEARADIARWNSWPMTPPARFAALLKAEIAELEAKERAAGEAKEKVEREATEKQQRKSDDADEDAVRAEDDQK